MTEHQRYQEKTAAAFADPQPGMRFHEAFVAWTVVTSRDGDNVTWAAVPRIMETSTCPTCGHVMWTPRRLVTESVEAFRDRHRYRSGTGYAMLLYEGNDDQKGATT